MGEVVVSSEELMEMKNPERKKDGMVKWERFLPRMALRILLVEADDSTRQIITALLRKSSYRVTAVPDGLKAWEIAKGRPHNIDLILTEVDLPSISGFALLTLIMEHEICKNIPVIMMSSQDSVSTVYKCMMRGAADYLVKPVRKNELRNMWQHVWRRQSPTGGANVTQDESVGQQKIEAISENDAASNHSSGYMACLQREEECVEKGSDAQSSCTKPDFEAESARMEDVPDLSRQLWGQSLPNDVQMRNHEASVDYDQKSHASETEDQVSEVAACKDANMRANFGKDVEAGSHRRDAILTVDTHDVVVNSSREVIDFMGAFDNCNSTSNNGTSKFDSSPELNLSLRRSYPSGFENQVTEQKFTLRHSNASAFTRYTNKPLEPQHSTLSGVCDRQKEFRTDSEKKFSDIASACISDAPVTTLITQRSVNSLATSQSKQSELAALCPQQRICPVPVSLKGIKLDKLCTGYGSVLRPMFCAQSCLSPTPSPKSACQQEPTFQGNPAHCSNAEYSNCGRLYDQLGEDAINSTNQTMHKLDHKLDSLEEQGHISPATDQSVSSSFCNGALSHLNSMGYGSTCGSNSNVDQVGRSAAESKNDEGLFPSNGNSHRSIQREAALTKFRLKRKDRCYEKKVRYESRKKLAEQRPRVKGQFVRQVHPETQPAESENQWCYSADG